MNETISPDERGRHSAPKAEGDSDAALSRLGAAERLHMVRMVRHAEKVRRNMDNLRATNDQPRKKK